MGREATSLGHQLEARNPHTPASQARQEDFVLEKSIFNNIFEKDIRRVFIYKKAERLAKALHLVAPAFIEAPSLRDRIDAVAIGLIDAAVLPPGGARLALSRELLALSSVLAIARTGGLLSAMNADLIAREAHVLLQEVAAYEEPRLFLDDAPTLADIARQMPRQEASATARAASTSSAVPRPATRKVEMQNKGHEQKTDKGHRPQIKDRSETVLSLIRQKGSVSIKDISTMIRGVSEKTIQRELASLVAAGTVEKTGERRWSTYSLA